jgi:hypothetical protein
MMEGPMDGASLYDDDILAWSEVQAAALRSLAGRHDLPNQLDLANVVEEIEDVGKSELRTVESLIRNIMTHVAILWTDPGAPAINGWRGEIATWHVEVLRRISPSMRPKLDLALVWRDALRVACAKLADWDKAKAEPARAALVGSTCPFDLAALTSEELDLADAIGRVQASAMPDKSP